MRFAVWAIEPQVLAFVVTRAVGQSFLEIFHPVRGQIKVLAGTIMDVVFMVL
jgi:hypothetical protein